MRARDRTHMFSSNFRKTVLFLLVEPHDYDKIIRENVVTSFKYFFPKRLQAKTPISQYSLKGNVGQKCIYIRTNSFPVLFLSIVFKERWNTLEKIISKKIVHR